MTAGNRPQVVKRVRGKKTLSPNSLSVKYVGRGSKLGNRYRIPPYTRKEAIDLYEIWLTKEIEKDPEFLSEYSGVNVSCWCHDWDGMGENPRYCHAGIVLEVANDHADH